MYYFRRLGLLIQFQLIRILNNAGFQTSDWLVRRDAKRKHQRVRSGLEISTQQVFSISVTTRPNFRIYSVAAKVFLSVREWIEIGIKIDVDVGND